MIPILFALLILVGCAAPAEQAPSYRQITMDEAVTMMDAESDYIIWDVRTIEEFQR